MVHLRIVVPAALAPPVVEHLCGSPSVISVVHLPGAALDPPGDLVLCDVAREDASVVLSDLRGLGLDGAGAVAVEPDAVVLGASAERAERLAVGSPADAVVWESVERATSESAELSGSFLAFMVLATAIAAVGILTDSLILIIGAMIVGPEFGPLAALSVAVVQRRYRLAARSLLALAVGFPVAIAAAALGTAIVRWSDNGPRSLGAASHSATLFISHPNGWSALVAALAGIAGTISLTTAKSSALIGVLVSVTTIPAAANIGVAGAYGDGGEVAGATEQLLLNLGFLVAAGLGTLALQRVFYARRRRRHVARTRRPRRR